MTTTKFILESSRKHNCTPSVVISALAGGKWPHSYRKHELRDKAEVVLGVRRLDVAKIAKLRAREHGFWLAFSGAKSQPLPLP